MPVPRRTACSKPPTAVDESAGDLPTTFKLEQNYPNPFNPSTTIRFTLPQREEVALKIFDFTGRELATLVNASLPTGEHQVAFDATNFPSGIYLYQIKTASFSQIRKAVLSK